MRKLKVYGVPWHTAHQYELSKLPFMGEYHLQLNPYRYWGEVQRPMPENMKYVTHYQKGYYDLAILHLDQQSIYDPEIGERLTKGLIYNELNSCIKDIPKIVINHMTPFHDRLETADVIKKIKAMVGNNFMIVNSREAARQWGWGNPIIHGIDAGEWKSLPKEPRCVVSLSPAGMEKAYRRIFLETVARILKQKRVPFYWVNVDINFNNFADYSEFIGRSLVYFNPTWNSPMPRARTEAMLAGCCIVTTPYHDANTFIKDGVNGFLTSRAPIVDPRIMDNPQFTADLIEKLVMLEPEKARAVGAEGRKTAMEIFSVERFHQQWVNFITKIVGIKL